MKHNNNDLSYSKTSEAGSNGCAGRAHFEQADLVVLVEREELGQTLAELDEAPDEHVGEAQEHLQVGHALDVR